MICNHSFHRIGDIGKPLNGPSSTIDTSLWRTLPGVEVACVSCGEVRRAYADGEVSVTVAGGAPIDEERYDDPHGRE